MWAEAQMYRWKAELQFDTRKRKCLRNYLCVICGLREQLIHHSANCWQLAFAGELIWWQPPAFSCHSYRSWEAYSCHNQAYWAHLLPSMHTSRGLPLWDREGHQEWTREINVAIKEALGQLPRWPQEGDLNALTAEPPLASICQWRRSLC